MARIPSAELEFRRARQTPSTTLEFGAGGDPADLSYSAQAGLNFTVSASGSGIYSANVFRGFIVSAGLDRQNAAAISKSAAGSRRVTARLIESNQLDRQNARFERSLFSAGFITTRFVQSAAALLQQYGQQISHITAGAGDYLAFAYALQQSAAQQAGLITDATAGGFTATERRVLYREHASVQALTQGRHWGSVKQQASSLQQRVKEQTQYGAYLAFAYSVPVVAPPVVKPPRDFALNFKCVQLAPSSILHFGVGCTPPPVIAAGVVFVTNTVSLTRTDSGDEIRLFGCDVGIDDQSFCWTFSADVAYQDLAKVNVADEAQIGVTLEINGQQWRFILDGCDDSSEFNNDTLKITGKSRAVLLAHPHAAHRGFVHEQTQSVVQIAQSELARGGAPSGFNLDWQLVDESGWLTDRYSYTNATPINALTDIAEAAGGFINAHPFDDVIRVLSRYPVPSWEWAGLTPEITLDNGLITGRSRKRISRPNYNGVLVSGTRAGAVSGLIKRSGTSGGYQPNQVSHQLITEQSVAIHRGRCELSNTGQIGEIGLTLPFSTGLLTPSTFVQVVDSRAWVGIVRGSSISVRLASNQSLDVTQRLDLERHFDKEAAV